MDEKIQRPTLMKCIDEIDVLMKEYKGSESIRGQLEGRWYFKMTWLISANLKQ